MKKNVFLVMALFALMAAVLPAQTDPGGTPGLKYTLLKGVQEYSVDKGKVKTGEVVIPDTYNNLPVTAIAKNAFSGSTITGITIPNSVKSIGDSAFKNCKNLTGITIPDSVTTMGKEVFDGCVGLTSATIGNSVTGIGERAFRNCKNLTSATIGNSVTRIEWQAFFGCANLTGITIPNSVTDLGSSVFADCTSLASVTIGNGVPGIGERAFRNCKNLTNITLGNSVTYIQMRDWSRNTAEQTNIENALYGPRATVDVDWAFYGCTSLSAINVNSGNTKYSSDQGILYNKDKTEIVLVPQNITGAITIPNGVTSIGPHAFAICTRLTSVTIPNSVTSIFMPIMPNGFTASTSPDIISINELHSRGIYSNSIEDSAFYGCVNLTAINVNSGNSVYSSQDGVLYNKAKTILIFCPVGKTGAFTIPNGVISIENEAFRDCTSLTSVTIPNSVTRIGYKAFYNCSNLTSVTFQGSSEMRTGLYLFPDNLEGVFTSFYRGGTFTRQSGSDTWRRQ